MNACDELSPLIDERASGSLPAADEAKVAAHLEACPGCRARAGHLAELLSLARVAAPSALEEREAASLPRRAAAAAAARRSSSRAHLRRWALGAAGVAAAAVATLVLVPHRVPRRAQPQAETHAALAAADGTAAYDEADAIAAAAWDVTDDADSDTLTDSE